MGSPMLITSEYVTTPPPSPPPGGVDTICTFKGDILEIDRMTSMVVLSILLLETF